MVSYLGLLVQFSPAPRRAGRCRQRCVWGALTAFRPHWVCPIQGCLWFPRLHYSGSRLLYMERAVLGVRFQFSALPQKRGFGCACVLCLPRPQRFRQPEAWVPSPRVRRAFSLRGPSAPPVGCLRLVFVQRSWPLAVTLLVDVDHPESQEVFR